MLFLFSFSKIVRRVFAEPKSSKKKKKKTQKDLGTIRFVKKTLVISRLPSIKPKVALLVSL